MLGDQDIGLKIKIWVGRSRYRLGDQDIGLKIKILLNRLRFRFEL